MRAGPLTLLAALALAPPARAAEPTTWILTTIAPEGSASASDVADVARAMEQASGGLLRIRTRLNGVLGDEPATLELLREGRVQVWIGSAGAMAELVPALAVLETPYLFGDVRSFTAKSRRVLERPVVSHEFERVGLQPFGLAFAGWRSLSSIDRAFRSPAELAGVRVRAQPAPLHRAFWRLLGAQAREAPLGEVQPLFARGEVEAADLPPPYIYATSIASHLRYVTRTEHMLQGAVLVLNRRAVRKLPARTQAAILGVVPDKIARSNRNVERFESEVLEMLRKDGVTIVDLTPAERASWKKALAPLEAEGRRVGGPAGADLLRAFGR